MEQLAWLSGLFAQWPFWIDRLVRQVDRSQDDLDSADARPAQQPGSARRVSMTPQKLGIPSGVQRSKSRSSINSGLSPEFCVASRIVGLTWVTLAGRALVTSHTLL